ncbi:MAG: methyltetrahydrofolate cobalamin methyltransferase [Atribacterota bacterium]|nr:methyltetrahydrofolate cobalamin methyltransferase [Atribacterota bacterium]
MLIIGEKINSTRKKVKEMIENKDVKNIQELAKKQVAGGADVLDINSSAANGDKLENMEWLIRTVQEAVNVPLCIDSPNPVEIEKGLAVYNWDKGKPIINSITGEKEKIEQLLPVIKEYKCSVIALAMDDRGISDTFKIRVEVAEKLIAKLIGIGISLSEIYIDPLVVPISTSDKNGCITINTISNIKKSYPEIGIVTGLSNISYGLPERKLLNQAFMVLAMGNGMNAAIVDSTDKKIMALVKATETLLGKDNFCSEYINAFRQGKLTF